MSILWVQQVFEPVGRHSLRVQQVRVGNSLRFSKPLSQCSRNPSRASLSAEFRRRPDICTSPQGLIHLHPQRIRVSVSDVCHHLLDKVLDPFSHQD
ncbi:hypothetical protein TNIN_158241 [Trichonephila inaurata madagascariensis]|uniref:Uncharacterized protein n=1 Tax=Trichonephila inaurata madagascariensis TaxID=2747483 RepID=A0A8X7BQB8_9ARAC|nr:hypothetical protein TNIN_158241 [Trichonephila inaurata madagascariensis]